MSPTNNIKAILVGIDEYDAGSDWNLNGCSHDVIRVARWLVAQGVNPDNLSLFISPLDENQNTLNQAQEITRREAQPATRDNIRNELIRFQQESANLFFFYWSGHGNVNQEGQRRLYYANATDTDRQNLDFNNLLQALRGEYYQNISEQLFIVDACANYISVTGQIPSETIEGGEINPTVFLPEQFALFAGKSGEAVTNLNREQIGLFTQHLLAELNLSLNPNQLWLPQMEDISENLINRFRNLGFSQTPTTLWYRTIDSLERDINFRQPTEETPRIDQDYSEIELEPREVRTLRDAFLECTSIRQENRRRVIYQELIDSYDRISVENPDRIYWMQELIVQCQNYERALETLINIVKDREGNSMQMQNLQQTVTEIFGFFLE